MMTLASLEPRVTFLPSRLTVVQAAGLFMSFRSKGYTWAPQRPIKWDCIKPQDQQCNQLFLP